MGIALVRFDWDQIRITRPSGGHHLPVRGYYEIAAWRGPALAHPPRGSLYDGGRAWKDAQIHDPVAKKAHTRFSIPWNGMGRRLSSHSPLHG